MIEPLNAQTSISSLPSSYAPTTQDRRQSIASSSAATHNLFFYPSTEREPVAVRDLTATTLSLKESSSDSSEDTVAKTFLLQKGGRSIVVSILFSALASIFFSVSVVLLLSTSLLDARILADKTESGWFRLPRKPSQSTAALILFDLGALWLTGSLVCLTVVKLLWTWAPDEGEMDVVLPHVVFKTVQEQNRSSQKGQISDGLLMPLLRPPTNENAWADSTAATTTARAAGEGGGSSSSASQQQSSASLWSSSAARTETPCQARTKELRLPTLNGNDFFSVQSLDAKETEDAFRQLEGDHHRHRRKDQEDTWIRLGVSDRSTPGTGEGGSGVHTRIQSGRSSPAFVAGNSREEEEGVACCSDTYLSALTSCCDVTPVENVDDLANAPSDELGLWRLFVLLRRRALHLVPLLYAASLTLFECSLKWGSNVTAATAWPLLIGVRFQSSLYSRPLQISSCESLLVEPILLLVERASRRSAEELAKGEEEILKRGYHRRAATTSIAFFLMVVGAVSLARSAGASGTLVGGVSASICMAVAILSWRLASAMGIANQENATLSFQVRGLGSGVAFSLVFVILLLPNYNRDGSPVGWSSLKCYLGLLVIAVFLAETLKTLSIVFLGTFTAANPTTALENSGTRHHRLGRFLRRLRLKKSPVCSPLAALGFHPLTFLLCYMAIFPIGLRELSLLSWIGLICVIAGRLIFTALRFSQCSHLLEPVVPSAHRRKLSTYGQPEDSPTLAMTTRVPLYFEEMLTSPGRADVALLALKQSLLEDYPAELMTTVTSLRA